MLRAIGGDGEGYDVSCSACNLEEHAEAIVENLVYKGYCSIGNFFDVQTSEALLREVEVLKSLDRFEQPPEEIAAGLLGPEGSAKIAKIASFDEDAVDSETAIDADGAVAAVDRSFGTLCSLLLDYQWDLGFEASHFSPPLIHEAGVPDEAPALEYKDVEEWLPKFSRHRVMALAFFGPMEGVLELSPHDSPEDSETEPIELLTKPGLVVLLRPDLLAHQHLTLGKALALSSFFLDAGVYSKRRPDGGWKPCPTALVLDAWAMSRLESLKEKVRDDADWDPELPRSWQRAMNLTFFQGHMTAVTGLAGRFPGSWDYEQWFGMLAAGPDAIVQVPANRWDHSEVYDPSPDSWKRGKAYCQHGAFMDGADLFDNKFFGLSMVETKGMDPNQRHLLEVAYASLNMSGQSKKSLMNSSGSVYAGNQAFEITFVAVPEECRGCGPTGGAGCIAANRISYIFGLKGPSMGVDTDTASSMSAIYLTAESVQRKGRGKSADFGVALGCALMVSPMWWHQHCALGWMTDRGRCYSFDASASGYVRAEACLAATLRPYGEVLEQEFLPKDKVLGVIAGCSVNSNGYGAGMAAPNAAAELELVAETSRSAGISALDIDAVETHGYGSLLGDAVEVSNLSRVHRNGISPGDDGYDSGPLVVTSVKTMTGHTMESSGIASLLKVILSAQYGVIRSNIHLRQANPHLDLDESAAILPTEAVDLWRLKNFSGVLSKGFNGTNGYCITWGEVNFGKVQKQAPGFATEWANSLNHPPPDAIEE